MVATVRLNEDLENILNVTSKILHKKKSDVIRDAIAFYAKSIEQSKKSKIANAVAKTKDIDKKEFLDFEGAMNDGM